MAGMTPAEAALSLLDALGEAYTAQDGVSVTLVPGQITTDDWCWGGCGSAYVRLDSAYRSTRFPAPDSGAVTGPAPLAARFHVGIHRCVAGVTEGGEPPSTLAQTEDALALLDDLCRLDAAISRWAKVNGGRNGWVLGAWSPVGPLGDCAGGFWPVTIRL
jgi:hypothetical protein